MSRRISRSRSRSRSSSRTRSPSPRPTRQRSRQRSRSISYSRSPPPRRPKRYFSPSPDRGFSTFFDVPSEFKRCSHFLQKLLLSGSTGEFGDKDGSFAKFTREECLGGIIDAGNIGGCLPFGYTSFLDLLRDIVLRNEFKYSLFVAAGLNNFWEECVVTIKEDFFELRRGVNSESVLAEVYYDDIYAMSPLTKDGTFSVFYDKNSVIRIMNERYEIGFIVFHAIWKFSETSRNRERTIDVNVDWEKFPPELINRIISFAATSTRDMGIFSLVSRSFYAATQVLNQDLWKRLYELEFNEIPYFTRGTQFDWKGLVKERKRIQDISAYDVLRCSSPSQRDLKISCGISFFDTHVFNCALFSGKWYYEFVMPEVNIDAIQVGVTTVLAKPFYHVGYEYFGVGDDDFSWSFDGVRSQRFHGNTTGGSISDYWQETHKWVSGDVIRVCMNMDDGELRFLHNHVDLGLAYNFPVNLRVTNFGNDDMAIQEPILPYFPAITCQQSSYGGDVIIEVILQRSKMRYPPPEGYSCLGELMEEKQFVDKICLTHIGESMTGLVLSKQLKSYIKDLEEKGYIEVPPGIENVGVDAGEYAQRSNTSTSTSTSYNDWGYDYY